MLPVKCIHCGGTNTRPSKNDFGGEARWCNDCDMCYTLKTKPFPKNRCLRVNEIHMNEIVEVAPGDVFKWCQFIGCRFVGVGPAMFRKCEFHQGSWHPVLHCHYYENEIK